MDKAKAKQAKNNTPTDAEVVEQLAKLDPEALALITTFRDKLDVLFERLSTVSEQSFEVDQAMYKEKGLVVDNTTTTDTVLEFLVPNFKDKKPKDAMSVLIDDVLSKVDKGEDITDWEVNKLLIAHCLVRDAESVMPQVLMQGLVEAGVTNNNIDAKHGIQLAMHIHTFWSTRNV